MRRIGGICLGLFVWSATLVLFSPPAWAIPSFARRYGVACSACHDAWPHLNAAGWSFRMSGYRRLNGRDLQPTTKDIELALGALTMPSIPPLSVIATVGVDYRDDHRRAMDGTSSTHSGSSIDLEMASVFIAAPLGKHLSTFLEFPLFETHAEAMDGPTGPGDAQEAAGPEARRAIQFETESPTFELGKLIWNSLLPESVAPMDSLNIVAGVEQLPTGFSAEMSRLSVSPYLVYRRRAIDLVSPIPPDAVLGDAGDRLLRLGEPQLQIALTGVLVPWGKLTDLGNIQVASLEYNVGMANGSNINADPNTQKDFFGRFAVRWWGQTLGIFGYWSPDIYDDGQRTDGSIPAGIFSGRPASNEFSSVGPDLTLSLEPLEIPIWLETQVLFNKESDPTGFGKSFRWWGGFSQLNAKIVKSLIVYGRYDWIRGERFDDTGVCDGAGICGVTGPVRPREWAAVGGLQWYVYENFKLLAEYGRREFENSASSPHHQLVEENFATVRASVGF